jgi:O-antigen/teichoic acid export membrane protein
MAKNKEKLLSLISILSLFINILVSFLLIRVFNVKMEYVILSTMISYFIFGLLSTYYVYKIISNYNFIKLFNGFLPVRLLIPYFVLIFSLSFNVSYASYISLLIFIILNFKELLSIIIYIKKAINNSSLIDL